MCHWKGEIQGEIGESWKVLIESPSAMLQGCKRWAMKIWDLNSCGNTLTIQLLCPHSGSRSRIRASEVSLKRREAGQYCRKFKSIDRVDVGYVIRLKTVSFIIQLLNLQSCYDSTLPALIQVLGLGFKQVRRCHSKGEKQDEMAESSKELIELTLAMLQGCKRWAWNVLIQLNLLWV